MTNIINLVLDLGSLHRHISFKWTQKQAYFTS